MININSKESGTSRHNCNPDMTRLSRFWRGCAPVPDTKSWWIHQTQTLTKNKTDHRSDIRRKEILTSQVGKRTSLLLHTKLCKTTGHLSERRRTWRVSRHISEERLTKLVEKLEPVTLQLSVKFQAMLKFRRLTKVRPWRWEIVKQEFPWCLKLRLWVTPLSKVQRASMIRSSPHIDASSKQTLTSTRCLKHSSSEFQKCNNENLKWKIASVT